MFSEILSNPSFVNYALISCILILIVWIIRLEIRISKLLFGKNGSSIEDSLVSAKENLEKLNQFQKEAMGYFENVEKRLKRSVQAIKTIRFNPFKGVGEGGNQSFSVSMVDEKGDGVVISSIYSRDRMSVFSKPLDKFESQFELTDEEKEVIKNSKESLK